MSIRPLFGSPAHVCIAVHDVETALSVYRDVMGFRLVDIHDIPDQGVRVAMLNGGHLQLELIEPRDESSRLHRFLNRRGEGLHHLAYYVEDLEQSLEILRERGLPLIDEVPRLGQGGSRIAFVHPNGMHGVLIELVERGEER